MPQFFIDRPVFAWVIALLILLGGAIALSRLPTDSYPVVAPPQVTITANYPGANARTVESTVTRVIEQDLTGIDNLLYFTSQSSYGQSQITLTFATGTNPSIAQVQTQNRVSLAEPLLPTEVTQQGIQVNQSSAGFLGVIALRSQPGGPDRAALNHWVAAHVIDQIERIPGVGSATLFGSDYAMRIWLNPNELHAYGMSAASVLQAIQGQNIQVAAGSIGAAPAVPGQQTMATVATQGWFSSPKQFGGILLRTNPNGSSVYLKNVAKVQLGMQNYAFSVKVNTTPVAAFGIQLLPGANSLQVMKAIKTEMGQLQKTFPAGVTWFAPVDSTIFIKSAIKDVLITILEAFALVFVVMLVFLQSLRTTLIPMLIVPTALSGALIGIYALGYSINQLTLFAMVLAIGILVDDAIVVVEAVDRIMREEHLPAKEAARKAMSQITGAIVAITLVLAAVFIPSALQTGSTGVIYRQFALTLSISMVFSAFLALSFSPALCASLMRPQHLSNPVFRGFNRLFEGTRAAYVRRVFESVAHLPRWMTGFAVIVALGLFLLAKLPSSFVPQEDQGDIMASFELPPGASLQRTEAVLHHFYQILIKNPAVHDVFQAAGANFSGTAESAGRSFIHLVPWSQRSQTASQIIRWANRTAKQQIHNASVFVINRPTIQGLGQFGGFDFYLEDRAGLGRAALNSAVKTLLDKAAKDPELYNVRVNGLEPQPELMLHVNRVEAESMGVSPQQVYQSIQLMLAPVFANQFIYDGRVEQVLVQAAAPYRMSAKSLQQFYVNAPNAATSGSSGSSASSGGSTPTMVPLSDFVRTQWLTADPALTGYDEYPAVEIVGSAAPGYSSGQAMSAMQKIVTRYLPHGLGYSWAGESLEEISSRAQAPMLFTLSILVVYLALAALYESWSIPASVLLAVPIGVIGSAIAMSLRGLTDDVFFKIGLVTIIGLTAKNAILIVEFAVSGQHNGLSLHKAVLEAVRLRFRPIIMTSFAFILGVFPMVVSTGAGANARHDLGTCVVGGMLTAVVLGVLLIPLCYVSVRRLLGDKLDEEPRHGEVTPSPDAS